MTLRTPLFVLAVALPLAGVQASRSIGAQIAPTTNATTQAPSGAAAPAAAATKIAAAAQAFVETLDSAQAARLQFPFEGPQRAKWSNLPTGSFTREGLRLGDLSHKQRAAAMALLATALSREGYQKVLEIMGGDEYFRKNIAVGRGAPPPNGGTPGVSVRGAAGSGGARFGDDEYYLAFLGAPSASTPWMLQFGGHHLAINLTLSGSQASMAPSLPAAQPATYTVVGRTIRPLGREADKAFELINALDATARQQAILGSTVADLVLGPGQDGRKIVPEGVRVSALTAPQRALLLQIIREWAGIVNEAFAEPRMAELEANLPQTYFAWSGPTNVSGGGYFRIQGPTLVIEYSPQGSPEHVHTIYRDPTNDYGEKIVRR